MIFQNDPILTENLPQAEKSPQEVPARPLLQVYLISAGIFAFVLLTGPVLITFLVPLMFVNLLVGGAWLLVVGLIFLATVKSFHRKSFSLREKDLTYRTGWLWHKVVSVPFTRVQHCEVNQGPIERAFGIAGLKVFTAGGSASDLHIPGLMPDRAREMNAFILQRITQEHA
jgi:membrane protein YdbS with pleckstrin-like domain